MLKVFWGASLAGKSLLNFCKSVGASPDFFTCNDSKAWGNQIDGVKILAPSFFLTRRDVKFYITSSSYLEIRKQLINEEIDGDNIFLADNAYVSSFQNIYTKLKQNYKAHIENITRSKGVLLENPYGDTLSGVQTWINLFAHSLKKRNISYNILTPSDRFIRDPLDNNIVKLERSKHQNLFYSACNFFVHSHYNIFVASIGAEMLAAACFLKRKYNLPIKIYTICHNDVPNYYQDYLLFQNEIDCLFSISTEIKNNFISFGFPANKIVYYPWMPTKVSGKIFYNYASPLKLVYLGRVVISQKRCDLLIKLAVLLKKQSTNFVMYIAGTGADFETISNAIQSNNLNNFVILNGRIDKTKVNSFLDDKDIFVSCSETEGHSFSQFESLSRGLIAVVTKCSGTSDDIKNGFNGFICKQGDLHEMSLHVAKLDKDRDLLHEMKLNSLKLFKKKQADYFDPIIKSIEQS